MSLCRLPGIKWFCLTSEDREAVNVGLRFVNNDACYPAIISIGQLVEALQSGEYDVENTSVLMTQTGGGCRATNYIPLLRKALNGRISASTGGIYFDGQYWC